MSKLEQIIEDYNDVIDWDGQVWLIDFEDRIKGIAIEYAEFYAKKCLEIAAENADIHPMRAFNIINKKTITEITLPNHE